MSTSRHRNASAVPAHPDGKAATISAMDADSSNVNDALRAALALQQRGDLAGAERAYIDLLARFGSQPDAEHMLGVTLHALGRSAEALAWFERAEQARGGAILWNNHAAALLALGRGREAADRAQRAVDAEPSNAGAWLNLGLAQEIERNYGDALSALARTLSLKSGNAAAIRATARIHLALCDPAAALTALRTIPEGRDEAADILRAQALIARGGMQLASPLVERIAAARSDDPRILALQAQIAAMNGESNRALELYDRILANDPDERHATIESAQLRIARGDCEVGLTRLRRWLERHPDDNAVAGTYFVACNYDERMTPSAQLAEHRRFPLACATAPTHRPRAPSPRLRVGWIKDAFGADLSAIFLENVLTALPRIAPDIEHVLYAVGGNRRPVTTHGWSAAQQDVSRLGDDRLVERIAADGIDILIDLMGRTTGNRACVFAARAAPVQMAWLDAFYTTGIGAMDYLISDPWLGAAGAEKDFTEKLIRLPHGRLAYNPPPAPASAIDVPEPRCFISLNRFSKVTVQVIAVWAAILDKLPAWTLLLKARGRDDDLAVHFKSAFARAGIDPDRIEIEGEGTYAEAMATYERASVALDPFPFSGCSTTCDALWMGLPVVTWPRETMASRQTAAWLSMAGKSEWIAASADAYIDIAIALANDEAARRDWRVNARDILHPAICDAERLAGELADALRTASRR